MRAKKVIAICVSILTLFAILAIQVCAESSANTNGEFLAVQGSQSFGQVVKIEPGRELEYSNPISPIYINTPDNVFNVDTVNLNWWSNFNYGDFSWAIRDENGNIITQKSYDPRDEYKIDLSRINTEARLGGRYWGVREEEIQSYVYKTTIRNKYFPKSYEYHDINGYATDEKEYVTFRYRQNGTIIWKPENNEETVETSIKTQIYLPYDAMMDDELWDSTWNYLTPILGTTSYLKMHNIADPNEKVETEIGSLEYGQPGNIGRLFDTRRETDQYGNEWLVIEIDIGHMKRAYLEKGEIWEVDELVIDLQINVENAYYSEALNMPIITEYNVIEPLDELRYAVLQSKKIEMPDVVDFGSWIATSVMGFMNAEIASGITIGGILIMIIAFSAVMWMLKLFAGG